MRGFFSQLAVAGNAEQMLPRCGACGLYKVCKTPKFAVAGKGRRKVLLVGDAPSASDDAKGKLLAGEGGRMLRASLTSLGIDVGRDVWVTNALICYPGASGATDAQVGYCRPNLTKALRELRPQVVVTLGRVALSSLLMSYWGNVGELARWVGWQIPMPAYWLCPTYNPDVVLKSNNDMMRRMFKEDLQRAFDITEAPPAKVDYESQVEKLLDEREVVRNLQAIDHDGGWVAFDYETNCLKPEYVGAKVVSAAVSNGRRTIAYPWTPRTANATRHFLHSPSTKKIASNLKFEERWTRFLFGSGVTNWGWDTMLAAHVLDSREGITGLKFQALVQLGVAAYNTTVEPYLLSVNRGHFNRVAQIEVGELLRYNGLDAVLEWQLAKRQRRQMGYLK